MSRHCASALETIHILKKYLFYSKVTLFSQMKGAAACLAQGGWEGPHPKLAPYYRRIGQLVRFGTLENSITFTPFFQPNQGHTTIHNMPPRDFMGSHTSLNPYSKKSGFPFLAEETNKKNFCFPLLLLGTLSIIETHISKIYFTKIHDNA